MNELLAAVQALKGTIPGIREISTGENFTDRALGYTHGLTVTLNNKESLPPYLEHPAHQAVGVLLRANCSILAMDYEF